MVSASYELDPVIGGRIFAEAANVAYMDVQRFSLADYGKAASLARDFYVRLGWKPRRRKYLKK